MASLFARFCIFTTKSVSVRQSVGICRAIHYEKRAVLWSVARTAEPAVLLLLFQALSPACHRASLLIPAAFSWRMTTAALSFFRRSAPRFAPACSPAGRCVLPTGRRRSPFLSRWKPRPHRKGAVKGYRHNKFDSRGSRFPGCLYRQAALEAVPQRLYPSHSAA